MLTMIITAGTLFTLHKLGFFAHLLKVCRMERTQPERILPQISERERLETEAGYILEEQGKNPRTVASMGDEMLLAIVRDYLITKEIL